MKLNKAKADVYIPDDLDIEPALERTTHLAIGAHQDDLEIFAYNGIAECYGTQEKWFSGVTVTNGAGSSRVGKYAAYSDEEMQEVRHAEQRKASYLGEYAAMVQLGYSTAETKDNTSSVVINDLTEILKKAQPEVVYVHNMADKHLTHVATALRSIAAIRSLPADQRPKKVYGCEVWRDLDWMDDKDKVALSTSDAENMAMALVALYDSQISGGKRYDLATAGRRLANATYFDSHSSDEDSSMTWAMDLTPLVENESLSITEYVNSYIDRFKADVTNNLNTLGLST